MRGYPSRARSAPISSARRRWVKNAPSRGGSTRGKSSGKHIAFAWAPPDDGGVYDLELVAGPHRVVIKDVRPREFHADWTIELDFPPFQHTCGAEVSAGDRANVVRVDCVTFDDLKGDPPQRVMLHKKLPSK